MTTHSSSEMENLNKIFQTYFKQQFRQVSGVLALWLSLIHIHTFLWLGFSGYVSYPVFLIVNIVFALTLTYSSRIISSLLLILAYLTLSIQTFNIWVLETPVNTAQVQILLNSFEQGFQMATEFGLDSGLIIKSLLSNLPILLIAPPILSKKFILSRARKLSHDTIVFLTAFSLISFHNKAFTATGFDLIKTTLHATLVNQTDYTKVNPQLPPEPTRDAQFPKILLIIGESEDRDAMQVYGNPVKNTPNLISHQDLHWFKEMTSHGGFTISSLVKMATLRKDENSHNYQNYYSLWQYAKSAGYYTGRISAGALRWGMIQNLTPPGTLDKLYSLDENYHEELKGVEALGKRLGDYEDFFWSGKLFNDYIPSCETSKKGKCFVTLRILGSHEPVSQVTPARYNQFENPYDNSLLYTDDFLDDLLKNELLDEYLIIFTSDHSSNYKLGEPVAGFIRFPKIGVTIEKSTLIENLSRPTTHTDLTKTIVEAMGFEDYPNDFESYNLITEPVKLSREIYYKNPN